MTITADDIVHLRHCVDLAREAFDAGDEPFGSILVSGGEEIFADRNRVAGGDNTRHPEFEIARWAAANLSPDERGRATVYTSGEHCPMCAAAHSWVGLGRIVYAVSARQLTEWRDGWGAPRFPVAPLPISAIAPDVSAEGPVDEFTEEMRALHRSAAERDSM